MCVCVGGGGVHEGHVYLARGLMGGGGMERDQISDKLNPLKIK